MAREQALVNGGETRAGHRIADHLLGMVEVVTVMAAVLAVGQHR
ncbi:hypothetical protein [Thermogemmatispora carboxidivorans]|nr:hypothetical protein [Thermogemmatispora carboxidivorans]